MPVWACVAVLHNCEILQYATKNSASVNAMAAALADAHRLNCPEAGCYNQGGVSVSVVHIDRDKLECYLGAALRQLRQVRICVNKDVADAMHPPDEPACRLRGCPVFSQGKPTDGLAPPDASARPGSAGDTSSTADKPLVRVVRCVADWSCTPCAVAMFCMLDFVSFLCALA